MATILDTVLLDKFSIIFTWILIFAVVFAISEATKLIQNKVLTSIIAFCMATLAVLTPSLPKILSTFAPWVVVIAIFFLFLLMLGNFLGLPTQQIIYQLGGRGALWWIMTPLIIALIFSLSNVFGQKLLEERTTPDEGATASATGVDDGSVASSSHKETVVFTLTNPKVLGVIFLLLIAIFSILFLTGTPGIPYPKF
ncbi:MAG: hypothetical protein V1702_00255 [Candidatus Woesearchaeota archaeon]